MDIFCTMAVIMRRYNQNDPKWDDQTLTKVFDTYIIL